MNSTDSSYDDVPESAAAPEEAPIEPTAAPPLGESTVSAPAKADAPIVPAARTAEQKSGRGAAGWALLLAAISLGVAGFATWQAVEWRAQSEGLREEVTKRLQESANANAEARALADREHESLNALLGKVGGLEGQISKSEGHAKALEALYERFSRSQEDRVIAEVRQAVEFADQQLRYAGNIETALIALRGALARLEQNTHGQFAALIQPLKVDIEKLSQQGTLDMPGTALRLEHALEKVDALPLAYSSEISGPNLPARPEKEEGTGVGRFVFGLAGDIWAELRSMVKFERLNTETEPVLLAPEQSAFLRENVKIRLLTARLAMLARDGHSYASDLERARNWIERFFDMTNGDVKAVVDELRSLEAVPVGVIRHELTESAAAVRRFQARGGEPPLPSAPEQTAPEAPAQSAKP
ncbi:MAG: uroporphyrinogen-III C-methyltransferase [Azoarcus sp.]|jgi:uroporphyrin-3 C-methyltransferase|nr:uroporphyrinogen-III C-methyltransferase [Azoarcus sp.]